MKDLVKLAKSLDFLMDDHSSNGHAKFTWIDQFGVKHLVTGPGRHSKIHKNDEHRLRQRMNRCKAGKCDHSRLGGSNGNE